MTAMATPSRIHIHQSFIVVWAHSVVTALKIKDESGEAVFPGGACAPLI